MRSNLLLLLLVLPLSLFALERDSTIVLNTSKGNLYGTLTTPGGKMPVPLVIIIAGSGPTDRNGNQPRMINNSLRYIGDSLGSRGIATLRYDKRGIAASRAAAPDEAGLRFGNYIDDAAAWVAKYAADKRFSKIYIAGHSEGSLIGMVAAVRGGVAGFISIAGAGVPADSIVLRQLGASPMIPKTMLDSMKMFFGMMRRGQQIDTVPPGLYQALLRKSVREYVASWMKYNPAEEIAKLKMPALIIQGTTDIQVDTGDAYALAAAKPDAKLVIVAGMNHVLKSVDRDLANNQLTYMDPRYPLRKEVPDAIAAFIRNDGRKK